MIPKAPFRRRRSPTPPRAVSSSSTSTVEGSGGNDGIVVPLQFIGSSMYDAAYTISVRVGGSKSYSLQVDTGSSDLWLASTSCSTSACATVGGSSLYNPSGATQTGLLFNISYLRGQVSGPIVWDKVQVGGYSIDNQALAAATLVDSEPLSSSFSGILGLALPLNSIIATLIPPVTDNSPDGAAWASNLFSLTPTSSAPASRFLSLSLSRPGSDRVPALLGIGHHPSSLVTDPKQILYSSLVSNRDGTLYWKLTVTGITVYVNGVAKPIAIGQSNTGAPYPSAVLDSGIPVILTTSQVANAIYGALGIGPASDGKYYVPCTTPLNMTVTLDNRPEIPLHPLDVTAEPPDTNQSQFCVGMIQAADTWLSSSSTGIGDMVLGVPFLRNTYTVMAYTAPYPNGSFPNPASMSETDIQPMLGLLALTDPKVALEEFHTVRLLNQPISSSNHTKSTSTSPDPGGKKISVGIIVLVGLIAFFSLCCALFGLRWFLLKKRFKKGEAGSSPSEGGHGPSAVRAGVAADTAASKPMLSDETRSLSDLEKKPLPLPYSHLPASSFEEVGLGASPASPPLRPAGDDDPDTTLVVRPRGLPFPNERINSAYTMSSGKTKVASDDFGGGGGGPGYIGEFGRKSSWDAKEEEEDATTLAWRGTWLVSPHSQYGSLDPRGNMHERNRSVSAPLLSHQHHHSRSFDSNDNRGRRMTLVGEGEGEGDITVVGPDLVEFGYRSSRVSPRRRPGSGDAGDDEEDNDDVASPNMGSMAGVGSAANTRRRLAQFESLPFPRESYYSVGGTSLSSPAAAEVGEVLSGHGLYSHHPLPPPHEASSEPEPLPPPPPSSQPEPGPGPRPEHQPPPPVLDDFDPYIGYSNR